MEYPKRTVSVSLKENKRPTAFTHVLIFKERLPKAMFTNGNFINIYPSDLPFIDFDKPVIAYNENEKERVPCVQKFGGITLSSHARFLYFHLHPKFEIIGAEEFIKEYEFKV